MSEYELDNDSQDPMNLKRENEQDTNEQSMKKNQIVNQLDQVTLRQLRDRNKDTENAINAAKNRINFMKKKEEQSVRKVLNVRRKLGSLEQVRHKAKETKQQSLDEKHRTQDLRERKSEFNKLVKDHLKYNKKIVMTLLDHKVQQDVKAFKEKKQQMDMLYHIQKDNVAEQNADKANQVRSGHIEAHEKRKNYFLERLKQFKNFKEKKLREQMRERERQEDLIMELEEKQRALLERLSVSERFRMKCQEEYEDAKRKYHSFYQAARGASRESSLDGSKAQIFIS